MFIDSLLLYGLTKELRETLLFSQVREIHQTDARVLVIELYRPAASPILLTLSAQNPPAIFAAPVHGKRGGYLEAGNFCMLLRKQLEGSRLSGLEQLHLDRVVRLSFDRIETDGEIVTRRLYLELIPSSPNLVFVEGDRVLGALIHGKKQHRELSAQSVYVLPDRGDRMDFMDFSADELLAIFRAVKGNGAALRDFLFSSFNGLSSAVVSRLFSDLSLPEDAELDALSDETLSALCGALSSLAEEIRAARGMTLYKENGKELALLLPLPGKEGERLPSISDYLARAAAEKGDAISASVLELKRRLRSLIKKEERKERKISEELAETEQAETYKLYGNLLTIYAYKKLPGAKSVTVDNPFDPEGREVTIPLSPEMDLIRNAQAYFKRYGKMKTRADIGREKREECLLKLEYLRNAEYFAEEIKTREALAALTEELREAGLSRYEKQKKRPTAKRGRAAEEPLTLLLDGFKVRVGQNSRQNENLTLHLAAKTDTWLHAQKIPGSHVVIEGTDIPESVLEKAAACAAWYSRGKNSGKVAVDYTLIRNVKKIKNGPPGLVSYTHQKTLVVTPEKPEM